MKRLLILLCGCFSPSFDSGKLQCSKDTAECPPGFHCVSGVCWSANPNDLSGNPDDLSVPDLGEDEREFGSVDAAYDLSGVDLSVKVALPAGTACSMGAQCVTGFCADGVCCDQACNGVCVACNLIASVGNCSPVPHGNTSATLGHPACTPAAQATCGFDGTCDGDGHCSNWAQGAVCQPSLCNSGSLTPTSSCDGKGSCVTPTVISCSPYKCLDATQCEFTCTMDTQCAATFTCNSNSCGPKPNGLPCTAAADCQNGHCADGVCCDSDCTGTCEKCNLGSSLGTCTAVSGAAAHGSCSGFGTTCGSACNGSNRASCVFTGAGTACNDGQSCTYSDVCDGSGNCAGTTITPSCTSRNTTCASYSCNGTATCAVAYNSNPCDDSNACTYSDTCNGSGTCAGTAVTCPGNRCIQYACNGTSSCVQVGFTPKFANCGTCHCGNVECDGAGNCDVQDGCRASGNCP